ncbi:MAG TPA: membrane protein insertion efficiency factor YidD [Candidatus Binatia bacterium]|nr:membrane protein insertion efficiency factor YidD [Candidatus Binatia bacterium]
MPKRPPNSSVRWSSPDAERRPLRVAVPVAAVRLYQRVLRPVLPPSCRFAPSCSEYAVQAIEAHGPGRGTALAVRRVLRCHPWNAGGYDPIPARKG